MGGYHILDFKNLDITVGGDAVKIDGVYESIEGSYHKAQMIVNLHVGGKKAFNQYVAFGTSDSNYVTKISVDGVNSLTVTVTADDNVTITA